MPALWGDPGGCAGANQSSMLAQRVAINGLANSYMAFNTNYHDTGLFGVYAVADAHAPVDDLAWSIMRELSHMVYNADPLEVLRAKTQLKSSILFSQDTPNGAAPAPVFRVPGPCAAPLLGPSWDAPDGATLS